ncbi:uncharacterized protein B0H18DRAFT_1170833 [Fomitopsis serialis]|uniref:uncharacterized protein n=1 Tax=Fomitopsis serialis TaxID=139415 RepID=UPI002007E885|nr:uncharacterized protein B0H18DRAFT_1170833 [Neoantrodia serialis]KAH9925275.1 hypothetical protein B0H18DRAFT_1170833 [Neoantrodia serialis]
MVNAHSTPRPVARTLASTATNAVGAYLSPRNGTYAFYIGSDHLFRSREKSDVQVLGPFPSHAREQHFLSPSYPLNLSEPIDFKGKWPSSCADGGEVEWTTAHSKTDGTLDVSFPHIRWAALRATEGWAGLQHHSVLHTTITVTPPPNLSSDTSERPGEPPRLLVNVAQGSFFTAVPQWYMGNIYAMERVLPQTVSLPSTPSFTGPTTYDLFVSGDYEIRLFGDPRFNGDKSGIPTLSIKLSVDLEPVPTESTVEIIPDHSVTCDFVDGWAFGDALGVGVRSVSGWWNIDGVSLATAELTDRLNLTLLQNTALAPTQTRIVPLKIVQLLPFGGHEIPVALHLTSRNNATTTLHTSIPVRQHPHWSPSEVPAAGIQATYLYGSSSPTAFLVMPPEEPNEDGAGVDILSMPFWIQAIPRQKHSWVVTPTGRTAWGLDWHGPSAMDAWGSVDALGAILKSRDAWRGYELADDTRVLLLGHSNGGQGAWWNAARYPDRVAAVIPAAAYLKSQVYVPLIQSHLRALRRPFLRAILETALTPDDNDLFLSNLAHTRILAIHGGDDENVPTWHSRAYVSTLKTWNADAPVKLREDPGELHGTRGETGLATSVGFGPSPDSFTLTVSIPAESGSLHGWRIHQLLVPGRIGRLTVVLSGTSIEVRTNNVAVFSIQHIPRYAADVLVIDGFTFPMDALRDNSHNAVHFSREVVHGKLARILTSPVPIVIIYESSSQSSLSATLRLASALDGYHKLDAEIIDDAEAVRRLHIESLGTANIVVVTNGKGEFAQSLLSQERTAFTLNNRTLLLRGSLWERSLRLFPIRTGVPIPDWVVITEHADNMGAGGIEGAGVWGNTWSWNEGISAV